MDLQLRIKNKVLLLTAVLLVMIYIVLAVLVLVLKYQENELSSKNIMQTSIENLLSILAYEQEKNDYAKTNEVISETTKNKLRVKVNSYQYFKNGFAIMFTSSGEALIHPTVEGKNISKTTYGARVLIEKKNSGLFEYVDEMTRTKKLIYYKLYKPKKIYVAIIVDKEDYMSGFSHFALFYLMLSFVVFSLIFFIVVRIANYFNTTIEKTVEIFSEIDSGNFNVFLKQKHLEATLINSKIKSFASFMSSIQKFAKELAEGNLNASFAATTNKSQLPSYLTTIRNNIKTSKEAEEQRKVEDEKMNWVNQGLAKFGELLRFHSDSLEEHCDNIIQNIVRYINANQGAIFLLVTKDQDSKTIDLISAFAYGSKKFIKKSYFEGEGLIGTCVLEKQTIYVSDVPDDYAEITSGLGSANPRNILICPIKNDEDVLGIVELSSFSTFDSHVIKFVEKILESVAATLKSAKINQETNELLKKFEMKKREMADNEEMMKQTIEEFKATEEESQYKEIVFENIIKSLTETLIFVEYNDSGLVTYANDNFVNLFGKENKQLILTTIKDHVHLKFAFIKDLNTFFDEMTKMKKHQTLNQYEIKEQQFWINDVYIPVKNSSGKLEKILRICTDVTGYANAEAEIKELKRQVAFLQASN